MSRASQVSSIFAFLICHLPAHIWVFPSLVIFTPPSNDPNGCMEHCRRCWQSMGDGPGCSQVSKNCVFLMSFSGSDLAIFQAFFQILPLNRGPCIQGVSQKMQGECRSMAMVFLWQVLSFNFRFFGFSACPPPPSPCFFSF